MGIEDICPVCGKTFYHGDDWGFRAKSAHYGLKIFGRYCRYFICSYPCFRKYKQMEDECKRKR